MYTSIYTTYPPPPRVSSLHNFNTIPVYHDHWTNIKKKLYIFTPSSRSEQYLDINIIFYSHIHLRHFTTCGPCPVTSKSCYQTDHFDYHNPIEHQRVPIHHIHTSISNPSPTVPTPNRCRTVAVPSYRTRKPTSNSPSEQTSEKLVRLSPRPHDRPQCSLSSTSDIRDRVMPKDHW